MGDAGLTGRRLLLIIAAGTWRAIASVLGSIKGRRSAAYAISWVMRMSIRRWSCSWLNQSVVCNGKAQPIPVISKLLEQKLFQFRS
jgi:hypothetical protein